MAIQRGELSLLPMNLPSDPQARSLFMSRDVRQLVLGPFQNAKHRIRAGRLRADLENFVRGGNVVVCLTPRKAKNADFGLLEPTAKCAWDFRSREPQPGLRLLGHFAAVDKFVALTWWPRSVAVDWSEKPPLGDPDGRISEERWRDAINECVEKWFEILPNSVPTSGLKVDNYVSGKFLLG